MLKEIEDLYDMLKKHTTRQTFPDKQKFSTFSDRELLNFVNDLKANDEVPERTWIEFLQNQIPIPLYDNLTKEDKIDLIDAAVIKLIEKKKQINSVEMSDSDSDDEDKNVTAAKIKQTRQIHSNYRTDSNGERVGGGGDSDSDSDDDRRSRSSAFAERAKARQQKAKEQKIGK